MSSGLVIVGGSYAAAQIAAAARKYGYDAPIRILSDEDTLPYQRPPLSKGFLMGGEGGSTLPLRAEAFYKTQCIDYKTQCIDYKTQCIDVELGVRVGTIDRGGRFVSSPEGRRFRTIV